MIDACAACDLAGSGGSARRERWGAPAATNAAVRGVLAGAGAQQRLVQREREREI